MVGVGGLFGGDIAERIMVETSTALPQSPSVNGVPVASPSGSGGGALGLGGGDVTFSALRELGGFSPDELEKEDFDAAKFVSAARRTVPLDQLCGSLAGHLAELRASLIDAINKDYAAFVGMASSLRGLDKAVSKARRHAHAHINARRHKTKVLLLQNAIPNNLHMLGNHIAAVSGPAC